jgi:hypothetical protein
MPFLTIIGIQNLLFRNFKEWRLKISLTLQIEKLQVIHSSGYLIIILLNHINGTFIIVYIIMKIRLLF